MPFLMAPIRILLAAMFLTLLLAPHEAQAQVAPQYGRFQPLNQYLPPGLAAQWAAIGGRTNAAWSQPVKVILDGPGDVSVYYGRPIQEQTFQSPAQFGVPVGHSYRLRISNVPGMPGVELFPTIEIIDRLHPPAGMKHDYPIPVHISQEDLEMALNGNLVTRVVYVEQPQIAAPFTLDDATRSRTLLSSQNVMEQADRYGRPVVILRLGGRVPSAQGELPSFYGTGGPIAVSRPSTVRRDDGGGEAAPADSAPSTSRALQNGRAAR